MVTACLLLIASSLQEAPVTIEPGLYSYQELAGKLSAPGRRVVPVLNIIHRGAVVAIKERAFEDVAKVLPKALGIRLAKIEEGKYHLETVPEEDQADLKRLDAYCAEFDGQTSAVYAQVHKLARRGLPVDLELTTTELQQALSAGSIQRPSVLLSKLDTTLKRAYAVAIGCSTNQEPGLDGSGPLYYYFNGGRKVKPLLNADAVDSGDGYYWRDRGDMPAWVRTRAVATIRAAEAELARKVQNLHEFDAMLSHIARNTIASHRIHFDPLGGMPTFTYSILASPATEDGWWGQGEIRALQLVQDEKLLDRIHDTSATREAFKKRLDQTQQLVKTKWATKPFKLTLPGRSLSHAISDYAKATGTDVLMEISTVRDVSMPRLNSDRVESATLESLAKWIGSKPSQTTSDDIRLTGRRLRRVIPPSWSLFEDTGFLVAYNEYRFLDRMYPAPLEDLLPFHRRTLGTPTLETLASITAQIAHQKMTWTARLHYAPLDHRFAAQVAWMRVLMAPAIGGLDKVRQKLLAGQALEVPMSRLGRMVTGRLVSDLQLLHKAGDTGKIVGQMRDAPLHPQFSEAIGTGTFVVKARKLPSEEGVYAIDLSVVRAYTAHSDPVRSGAAYITTTVAADEIPRVKL